MSYANIGKPLKQRERESKRTRMAIGHHNALNGSENNINWPDLRSLFNQTFNSLRCFAYKITE